MTPRTVDRRTRPGRGAYDYGTKPLDLDDTSPSCPRLRDLALRRQVDKLSRPCRRSPLDGHQQAPNRPMKTVIANRSARGPPRPSLSRAKAARQGTRARALHVTQARQCLCGRQLRRVAKNADLVFGTRTRFTPADRPYNFLTIFYAVYRRDSTRRPVHSEAAPSLTSRPYHLHKVKMPLPNKILEAYREGVVSSFTFPENRNCASESAPAGPAKRNPHMRPLTFSHRPSARRTQTHQPRPPRFLHPAGVPTTGPRNVRHSAKHRGRPASALAQGILSGPKYSAPRRPRPAQRAWASGAF
jgi:hypothetical protein